MERQNLEPWEEESTNVSNPLDARISKVSDETSKYFFEMDSAYQTLMGKFQKDYFRIMSKFYAEDDLEEMDFQYDSFKQKMSLILDSLEINSEEMETNIDRLAKVLLEEKQNYSSQKSINRVLALATVKKMNEIIVEWTNTQKKVEKNFEPKNQFIEIMNAFLNGKKVEFRANNSPTFRIKNRIHDSSVLSSGEKQLLIFMMAALNQKRSTHVFIADEPELSLHVDWQVMLVENIQTINPAAQVIFATHSPDIVGDNKGNVIDISVRD